MAALEKFEKQPSEQIDFDVHFDEHFDELGDGDYLVGFTTAAATGIDVLTANIVGAANHTIKFWVAGGTSGTKYRITFLATTFGGRKLEADIDIVVKEQ